MTLSNLLLDTCVAIKKLQENKDGEDIREFLSNKNEYLSKYSIMEFKKTFVDTAKHLYSMIEEGRDLREIYKDINEMIRDPDFNLSRLGKRLEILLVMMNSPLVINEKVRYYLKMWCQGYLTLLFIGNIQLLESITKCPIGDSFKGTFSEKYCEDDTCELQKSIKDYKTELNNIKEVLNEITDVSFRDMKIALNNDLNNFDKSKCQNIGDLIIAFDYLNFFENKKDSALCTTDHHFDTICKKLEINKVNPLTEEIFIYPT